MKGCGQFGIVLLHKRKLCIY